MINIKCFAISIGLLILSNLVFSQSNYQLHTIKPKWKLGDLKKVHTESYTNVFIKDSLYSNIKATANYSIKIIDTINNYTVSYVNEPNSLDIATTSSISKVDSLVNILTTSIKNIEKKTQTFDYEILVDKNTGQAIKIKNSDIFLKTVEQLTSNMIDELSEKTRRTNREIDSLKQKVVAYFKLVEPKILETVINEFNYIMQSYSYKFPYNSSISQKAMIHDVNALGEFGDIEVPAILTISSKKYADSLTIRTDTDYDKNFLLDQLKKKHKNMSEFTTSDIFLSENQKATFTTVKNWIVSEKSSVVFKTKDVRVINVTQVNFQ